MIHTRIFDFTAFRLLGLFLTLCVLPANLSIQAQTQPSLADGTLKIDTAVSKLTFPTDMAFLGLDDFLVLEQYNGTVIRVNEHKMFPLLDLNVAKDYERGLLGVAVLPQQSRNPFVYIYYTETESKDGGDIIGNRLYRYTFVDDSNGGKLVNRTLVLDLPAFSALNPDYQSGHNGGKIVIGPDGNLYLTIGDVYDKTKAQNYIKGINARGTGGILRVTPNGETVGNGILGPTHPLDKYYAYGIRNSYGIDFDPVTGYLWDTENNPARDDEINLVEPGFNSGWQSVTGFIKDKKETELGNSQKSLLYATSSHISNAIRSIINGNETAANESLGIARSQMEQFFPEIYDFEGKGTYSDPEFVWQKTAAPTALRFYNSSVLGEKYLNQLFVGEFNTGKIQIFPINSSRTGFDLSGALSDRIAKADNETESLLFGKGFGGVTDMEVGPDGFLYVVERIAGKVSRIFPQPITGTNTTS